MRAIKKIESAVVNLQLTLRSAREAKLYWNYARECYIWVDSTGEEKVFLCIIYFYRLKVFNGKRAGDES